MTSEIEALKTNEFNRRRKLRIQQVREQSKDIAKKIRQRAKVEKWRHIGHLDAKKEKEYLQHQEKLVQRLEEFYVKGLENVGAGHKHATEVKVLEDIPEKTNRSKVRAKEAAAELRRKKQEKLDEQKKLLDRKVQAREAANEISREKTSTLSSKLLAKSTSSKCVIDINSKANNAPATAKNTKEDTNAKESTNNKEGTNNNAGTDTKEDNNSEESDKPELVTCDMATQWDFEEMPNEWEPHIPKLSLPKDDRDSVKEFNSNKEGKGEKSKRLNLFALSSEMPSSLRGGLSSVPEEQAPRKPSLTLVSEYLQNRGLRLREYDVPSTSKKPVEDLHSIKQTIMRARASKAEVSEKGNPEKLTKSSGLESALNKKNSVTMYNHSTRDTKDVPCGDRSQVVRDPQTEEDAYSQAMKEAFSENATDKEHQKKLQDMRNTIAMTKQNVEKEYKDTMAFLSSLPKDNSKPMKNAYMDEHRQQMQKENRQRKLQQEFQKIEKECTKSTHKHPKPTIQDKRRSKSKSPGLDSDEDLNAKDFQYSWMPVPESDGNLAIHTIPTTLKQGKPGNTVKFNKVDSYHEYRSRHKHTPPTKDTMGSEKNIKKTIETVIIQPSDNESTDCSSISSDTSSVENLRLDKHQTTKNNKEEINLSNAERIIIYKVLENRKKSKKAKLEDVAKSAGANNDERTDTSLYRDVNTQKTPGSVKRVSKNVETKVSFEQLNEGVYKTVKEKGDNITSMYFSESPRERQDVIQEEDEECAQTCICSKKLSKELPSDTGTDVNMQHGNDPPAVRSRNCNVEEQCKCAKQADSGIHPVIHTSAATSTASFQTATNVKASRTTEDGFVKLLDEGGHEAGKVYIGASGLLKDDAYELIIQLRKKDGAKDTVEGHQTETEKSSITMVTKPSNIPLQTDSVPVETAVAKQPIKDNQEQPSSRSSPKKDLNVVVPQCSPKRLENTYNDKPLKDRIGNLNNEQAVSSGESSDNMLREEPISDANGSAHKGVYTPFQMSYAFPSNFPKSDVEPRPAASTHTQTTPISPRRRPVFIQMSSSTSTAYMSPPEFVLPKFFKHNYKLSHEEMTDPTQNSLLENASIEEIGYYEEYDGCKCRRCAHAKKVTLTKIKRPSECNREKIQSNVMKTPPNSARSFAGSFKCEKNDNTECNKRLKTTRKAPQKQTKTCQKCESRTGSKTCFKTHAQKPKRNIALHKKSSRKCVLGADAIPSSTRNKSAYSRNEKCFRKPNLNPIVKSYVDKLLALNKEGLKAFEVINQDCSSVTTPGSSIIEVNRNLDNNKPMVENKISLEQIKDLLTQQILEKYENNYKNSQREASISTESNNGKQLFRIPRKKSVHKVKSLNISKNIFTTNTDTSEPNNKFNKPRPHSSSTSKKSMSIPTRTKSRSKSSPSPRRDDVRIDKSGDKKNNLLSDREVDSFKNVKKQLRESQKRVEPHRQTRRTTITSSDSEANGTLFLHKKHQLPTNTSTQTSRTIDDEINFMKMAENKLQNMEKIADLTEKCTQRLSNLAKVLQEVRRNKSLAYSQISDSISDSDRKSDKISTNDIPRMSPYDQSNEINEELRIHSPPPTQTIKVTVNRTSETSENNPFSPNFQEHERNKSNIFNSNSVSTDSDRRSESTTNKSPSPVYDPSEQKKEIQEGEAIASMPNNGQTTEEKVEPTSGYSKFTPFLSDIPKPDIFKCPAPPTDTPDAGGKLNIRPPNKESFEHSHTKSRGKPPPALSRMNLKHGRDIVVPHELSTVIEVDSPMSAKHKNQSTQNETKYDEPAQDPLTRSSCDKELKQTDFDKKNKANKVNPDLLQSDLNLSKRLTKMSTDSSDDSKLQMMDLNKFNEIMLKPFISIREYAKQCNVESLDEGSNLDDIPRDDVINDDLSSLHSDASLPDVIAELLKRNIISEPFKFDTVSNVNSTTVSSESTLSMLALSKVRKGRKKPSVIFQNKENSAETSDTLSISSNPDLENAFKKLGMGWASSTLKKTKERLALSSSSNTSSSSLSQFKVPNVPELATDSTSSALHVSNKSLQGNVANECSKSVEQQTSMLKSMTVKEFLTNELSKIITFTNKSHRNDTEEEFVSLYETKMPEEMKHASPMMRDERSIDSGPNGSNNRARTSTPVQIFKSMTYHSSSSSNISNGLFSNADDLSSVKGTSNSMRNHSTSDKDDLTIPNYSLRMRKDLSDCSKSD